MPETLEKQLAKIVEKHAAGIQKIIAGVDRMVKNQEAAREIGKTIREEKKS